MKYLLALILFITTLGYSQAQSADAYAAGNEGWMTNLEEAYELSKETNRPILANFTGSDWCGWCKRLTKDVFSKEEFQEWADEHVILLELDFPKRHQLPKDLAQQNMQLSKAFKVKGYPTIWVFDLNKKDGQFQINALGKTGYTKTPTQFISDVEAMLKKRS